jgi:hypothetical protein
MKKLYLDDIRTPRTKGWDIVRSYDEFIGWIEINGLPDMISFDHDLGDETTKTGYDCAKWLVSYCTQNNLPYLPEYNIHSANPVGKANIESYLSNAKKHLNKL